MLSTLKNVNKAGQKKVWSGEIFVNCGRMKRRMKKVWSGEIFVSCGHM